ncbi:MAG: helix-turn-helix domain-containing protein [Gammaproteobacteria bacterium]|nr:MAG: helix-turn-helix domain-containing protein [Gammaproteobacteria bacterium]
MTTDEKNSSDHEFSESVQSAPAASGNIPAAAEQTISADRREGDFSSHASAPDNPHRQLQTNNNYNNMNAPSDNQPVKNEFNSIDSASVVQSIGHLLRNARTAKGLSIDDVSRQLRLSAQQIEAIEKEDFERLPGRTFLRGFIRNYANLVQLDPAPLMQMLPESTRVVSTYERTPFKNKQISFSSNREKPGNHSLIIASILFVIVLGAYFLFENGGWNKNSDVSAASEETKTESATASVEIQLPLSAAVKNATDAQINKASEIVHAARSPENAETLPDTKTDTAVIEVKPAVEKNEKTEKAEKIEKTEKADKKATTEKNTGHLYFKFTADSWVKVVDGTGTPVFEQLKKGGSEQTVTGKRPLSIVIGNASGVNLTYNDKEIDISLYKKQGGTARFTLE